MAKNLVIVESPAKKSSKHTLLISFILALLLTIVTPSLVAACWEGCRYGYISINEVIYSFFLITVWVSVIVKFIIIFIIIYASSKINIGKKYNSVLTIGLLLVFFGAQYFYYINFTKEGKDSYIASHKIKSTYNILSSFSKKDDMIKYLEGQDNYVAVNCVNNEVTDSAFEKNGEKYFTTENIQFYKKDISYSKVFNNPHNSYSYLKNPYSIQKIKNFDKKLYLKMFAVHSDYKKGILNANIDHKFFTGILKDFDEILISYTGIYSLRNKDVERKHALDKIEKAIDLYFYGKLDFRKVPQVRSGVFYGFTLYSAIIIDEYRVKTQQHPLGRWAYNATTYCPMELEIKDKTGMKKGVYDCNIVYLNDFKNKLCYKDNKLKYIYIDSNISSMNIYNKLINSYSANGVTRETGK